MIMHIPSYKKFGVDTENKLYTKTKLVSHNKQNALTKHIIKNDDFFGFDRIKIVANEHNYEKRLLLEMCLNEYNIRVNQEMLFFAFSELVIEFQDRFTMNKIHEEN